MSDFSLKEERTDESQFDARQAESWQSLKAFAVEIR